MTPAELAAILARAEAATAGPWTYLESLKNDDGTPDETVDRRARFFGSQPGRGEAIDEVGSARSTADVIFCAHARTDVPALCDALEAERKANDTLLAGRVLDVERLRRAEQDLRSVQRDFDDVVRERDALRARVHELEQQIDDAHLEALATAAREDL